MCKTEVDPDRLICVLATCALATMDAEFAERKGFANKAEAVTAFNMLATPANIATIFERYQEMRGMTDGT